MNKIKKKKTPNGFKNSFQALSLSRKWLLFGALALIVSSTLPAVIILLIGLLPTITVLITDPKNSGKLIVIGSFNLAGLFVYLINIINHFTLDGAFSILSDAFNLIIMLGSAALGFIVYYEVPNLFVFLSKISAKKRLENIDKQLQNIKDEWGPEIIDNQINKLAK